MESLIAPFTTTLPVAEGVTDLFSAIWNSPQRWGLILMMAGFVAGVYGNAGHWPHVTAVGIATVFVGVLVAFASTEGEGGFGNALGRILPIIAWIVLAIVGTLLTAHGWRSIRGVGVVVLPIGLAMLGFCGISLMAAIFEWGGPLGELFDGSGVPLLDS